ncbi:hypothetical protein FHL15_007411 [Xylaria flabelliformis]|uniref:Uncharacterized protein n=1 Tax=Xylaria flabelliformis TaxID=2512241 RepID=A0A553HUJ8_9PEZI|nr:hypothetical protein FHL15_007411 [Xylaria flabelliformis]
MQGQDITQMLLDMNVGIAARSKNGSSPLHIAALASNIEVILSFLNKGADIEAVNYDQVPQKRYARVAAKRRHKKFEEILPEAASQNRGVGRRMQSDK